MGQNLANNPVETEIRAYRLPKPTAAPQPKVSSRAPSYLSSVEAEVYQGMAADLVERRVPCVASVASDPWVQVGMLAHRLRASIGP